MLNLRNIARRSTPYTGTNDCGVPTNFEKFRSRVKEELVVISRFLLIPMIDSNNDSSRANNFDQQLLMSRGSISKQIEIIYTVSIQADSHL